MSPSTDETQAGDGEQGPGRDDEKPRKRQAGEGRADNREDWPIDAHTREYVHAHT